MNATIPEGRRTAATWIAATGAFLLVASAALFVAVRWDELSDAAKLGVLTTATGCALAGGRSLQRQLPATGAVVFHLGAFLVPVNVAAALLQLDLDWRRFLLVEAVASTAAFAALAVAARSATLRWAPAAGVITVALGAAAVSPLPAGIVLAVFAAGALAAGERRLAVAWAAAAGLGPVAAAGAAALFASAGGQLGLGVLTELGLAASQPTAVVGGIVSAGVLAVVARRTSNLGVAFLAGSSLVSTSLVSWLSVMDRGSADGIAAATLFLGIEVAAITMSSDPLWRRLAEPVAIVFEAVAAVVTVPLMGLAVLLAPLADQGLDIVSDEPGWSPEPTLGAAAAITALAWTAAALRIARPRSSSFVRATLDVIGAPLTVVPIALSVVAAVALATASPLATAVAAVVVAVSLVCTGHAFALIVAAGASFWASITAHGTPEAAALLGSLGAVACAAGLRRHHMVVAALTFLASTAAVIAGWAAMNDLIGWGASITASVAMLWVAAAVAGEADQVHGLVGRLSFLAPLAIAVALPADEAFLVCSAVALFLSIDAWRTGDERVGVAAVLSAQAPIALGAHLAGFDLAGIGLVMCAAAVVAAGLATLSWPKWESATTAAVVAPLVLGLSLTSVDASAFGTALLIAGGISFVAALVAVAAWLAHLGGAFLTAGTWVHLMVADVQASEPYIAPIALHLAVIGWQLRRTRSVDSWAAFGPAVAILGGSALAERIDGSGAWHAVVAGAVGVIAVSAGGWFRLIAPLILGTAILVTVTVYESLATLATVPTWAWLALGGTTLLGVGVALERTGTSPVEAGRRVADVLSTRFD